LAELDKYSFLKEASAGSPGAWLPEPVTVTDLALLQASAILAMQWCATARMLLSTFLTTFDMLPPQ
jgi:hypothetical protein